MSLQDIEAVRKQHLLETVRLLVNQQSEQLHLLQRYTADINRTMQAYCSADVKISTIRGLLTPVVESVHGLNEVRAEIYKTVQAYAKPNSSQKTL